MKFNYNFDVVGGMTQRGSVDDVTQSQIDRAIAVLTLDNVVVIDKHEANENRLAYRRLMAFAQTLSDIENDPKGEKLIGELQKLEEPPTVEQFLLAIDKHLLS